MNLFNEGIVCLRDGDELFELFFELGAALPQKTDLALDEGYRIAAGLVGNLELQQQPTMPIEEVGMGRQIGSDFLFA
jgi:hypothetical protein